LKIGQISATAENKSALQFPAERGGVAFNNVKRNIQRKSSLILPKNEILSHNYVKPEK
jgi:hypothetical protein